MSYKINRLIKNKNHEGTEEVFLDLVITDDLGTYSFGQWITPEEYQDFKNEYDSTKFTTCSKLSDFTTANSKSTKINIIAEGYLAKAKQLKEQQIEAEQSELTD